MNRAASLGEAAQVEVGRTQKAVHYEHPGDNDGQKGPKGVAYGCLLTRWALMRGGGVHGSSNLHLPRGRHQGFRSRSSQAGPARPPAGTDLAFILTRRAELEMDGPA
jgi:hypothetical protein